MGLLDETINNTPPRSPSLSESQESTGFIEVIEIDDDFEFGDDDLAEQVEYNGDELMEEENALLSPAIATFSAHASDVLCGDIIPIKKNIAASGGMDEKLYVWDFSNTEPNVLLEAKFPESIDLIKFSPNGKYLAASDMVGQLKVFNTDNWTIHFEMDLEDECSWISWHPSFPVLISVVQTHVIMINTITKETKNVIWCQNDIFARGNFLPDGKCIAVASDRGTISIVDLKSATVVKSATAKLQQSDSINCLDIRPDGAVVLCGSSLGDIFSFSTENAKITKYDSGLGESDASCVENIGYSKSQAFTTLAASIHLSGVICFWDTLKKAIRAQCVAGSCTTQMAWHPSEPILFTSIATGNVLMVDGRTGNLLKDYLCHQDVILGLAVSSDGSYFLTTSEDKKARVFQVNYESNDGDSEMEVPESNQQSELSALGT